MMTSPTWHALAPLLPAVWAGAVSAASFIAQPAKFSTPGLGRPLALAAGRQMFRAVHKAEAALAIVGAALALALPGPARWLLCAAILILLLQLQLMAPLSRRVDVVLAGCTAPASALHLVFGALELAKLLLLAGSALLLSLD